jgi:hypothetical protein
MRTFWPSLSSPVPEPLVKFRPLLVIIAWPVLPSLHVNLTRRLRLCDNELYVPSHDRPCRLLTSNEPLPTGPPTASPYRDSSSLPGNSIRTGVRTHPANNASAALRKILLNIIISPCRHNVLAKGRAYGPSPYFSDLLGRSARPICDHIHNVWRTPMPPFQISRDV